MSSAVAANPVTTTTLIASGLVLVGSQLGVDVSAEEASVFIGALATAARSIDAWWQRRQATQKTTTKLRETS